MSLISENTATVVQAADVVAGTVSNVQFQGGLNGAKVMIGYVKPRVTNESLAFVDENDVPLQLPLNSIPIKACFVPVVPLESPDLTNTFFRFSLYDNLNFDNIYQPWALWSLCDGERMNAKVLLELADSTENAKNVNPYPYVGVDVSGPSVATNGTIKLYLFYV